MYKSILKAVGMVVVALFFCVGCSSPNDDGGGSKTAGTTFVNGRDNKTDENVKTDCQTCKAENQDHGKAPLSVEKVTTIIANIAIIAGTIVALITIFIALLPLRHNKKRLTMEFYQKISLEIDFDLDILEDEGKPLELSRINGSDKDSKELKKNIVEFLSRLSWLATGIALNIYDFKTLYSVGGQYILRKYDQLNGYILEARKHDQRFVWYRRVEVLVETIKEYEENHPGQERETIKRIRAKARIR